MDWASHSLGLLHSTHALGTFNDLVQCNSLIITSKVIVLCQEQHAVTFLQHIVRLAHQYLTTKCQAEHACGDGNKHSIDFYLALTHWNTWTVPEALLSLCHLVIIMSAGT